MTKQIKIRGIERELTDERLRAYVQALLELAREQLRAEETEQPQASRKEAS